MFIAAAAHVPSVIFLSSNPCVTSRLTSTSVLRLNLKTPPFLPSPIPCRSPPPPPMSTGVHFPLEDPDLDDDDIWAVIDSAAASRSRKPLLAPSPASMGSKPFRNPRLLRGADEPSRVPADGEVVQDDRWNHFRPPKIARFVESGAVEERRMVVVRNAMRTPVVAVSSPSYESPDQSKFVVKTVSPVVESPPAEGWKCEKENRELNFGSGGMFPSVSSFKHYQNAAMAILEKNDYTMIHGNPFIKKSGWRKISFFFNLSYEIKDKSIEFDEDKNVQRAEFVVRAYMKCGRFSDGWGSCERREKRFLKPNHDIPSTAETRAKNRACQDLLGIGEYRPGVGNAIR